MSFPFRTHSYINKKASCKHSRNTRLGLFSHIFREQRKTLENIGIIFSFKLNGNNTIAQIRVIQLWNVSPSSAILVGRNKRKCEFFVGKSLRRIMLYLPAFPLADLIFPSTRKNRKHVRARLFSSRLSQLKGSRSAISRIDFSWKKRLYFPFFLSSSERLNCAYGWPFVK